MEDLRPFLEQLAVQMNTTVEFLWEIMMRQARISAIGQIVMYLFYPILPFVAIRYLIPRLMARLREERVDNDYHKDGAAPIVGLIFVVAILLIATIMVVSSIPDLLTKLLNPEYWALQEILRHIR